MFRKPCVTVLLLVILVPTVAFLNLPDAVNASGLELTSDPDCVSWGSDRIDCFARGQDNALWHVARTGDSWTAWESLGGVLTSGPTVASWFMNRLDVFAVGADSGLWHKAWDGYGWSEWESLGGILTSDPDCVSWGPNHIDCFARGVDYTLAHIAWGGTGWTGWESLGGILTSGPGAGSVGPGYLDVFVRSNEYGLCGIHYDPFPSPGWQDWGYFFLGGTLDSDPDVVERGHDVGSGIVPDRVDVVVRGVDKTVGHIAYTAAVKDWGQWESLGGTVASGPTIVNVWGQDRLEVFAVGMDNGLWYAVWDGQTWGGWQPVPMDITFNPLLTGIQASTVTLVSYTPPPQSTATTQTLPTLTHIQITKSYVMTTASETETSEPAASTALVLTSAATVTLVQTSALSLSTSAVATETGAQTATVTATAGLAEQLTSAVQQNILLVIGLLVAVIAVLAAIVLRRR